MPPSLLDYLCTALQADLAGTHPKLALDVLRSDPTRSHALFPHATNAKSTRVYHEDIFVVLSQPVHPPPRTDADADAAAVLVPVVGIEAALYTVPATGTALLYISKVDTTGLLAARPSPTRPLVAAFLSYFLLHPPHHCTRVRIHVFARAQSQYLFPGSVDNRAKTVLDDKALIRWWKRTLEVAVARQSTTATATTTTTTPPRLFYLIPGLAYLESLPYVPATTVGSSGHLPWTYSHPYATLSSPLHPATDPPSAHPLVDHIPAFPDDPKSRFLHSLTSSSVAPSGTEGDYDDVFLAVASSSFTTGQTPAQKLLELDRATERERKRLVEGVPGGVDEWWERMAFRQECCAGQLVGFFVVAAGEPEHEPEPELRAVSTAPLSHSSEPAEHRHPSSCSSSSSLSSQQQPVALGPPKRHPLSLRPSTYTKLWSQLHNYDYALSAVSKLGEAVAKWEQGLEQALKAEEDLGAGNGVLLESSRGCGSGTGTETGRGPAVAPDDGAARPVGEEADQREDEDEATRREREWRRRYEKFVRREIAIENPLPTAAPNRDDGAGKRTAEVLGGNGEGDGPGGAPKVNVLAPRKKKKKQIDPVAMTGPLPPKPS